MAQALGDHYFDVDERGLEQVIARTAEFSKHVRYYNARNIPQDSWKDLFANDEAVVMADILTTDSARMEAEFLPLLHRPPAAAAYMMRFSLRIDRWYQSLINGEDDPASLVSRRIKAVVEQKLRSAIQHSAAYLPAAGQATESVPADAGMLSAFHPMWGFSSKQRIEPAARGAEAEAVLRSSFYSLVSAMSYLKPIAADRLTRSLKSGNHDPSIALFLAFAGLLIKAQEKINLFTARHRDFYYCDVLRMTAKAQVMDSTFLVLKKDSIGSSLLVPAGTAFAAGKVGGKVDLIYRSDADLLLTNAQVQSLRTLHCPRDPQISPEHELGYVDGLRAADILSESTAKAGVSALSWPLFGADRPGAAMSLGHDASIGFAVASSALQLTEGERQIRLTLSFRLPAVEARSATPTFGQRFRRLIFGYTRATKEEKDAFAKQAADLGFTSRDLMGQGQDPKYIFKSVVGACFNICITAATGWYAIKNYGVFVPSSPSSELFQLMFEIKLEADAPALVPYHPAIHSGSFDTKFPVLRLCLNPQANIYGYSLFCDLSVEEIVIESKIEEATRVLAWNQFGQLDPSKPFTPFGPLPTTNSYLILGNYDSARMNLTDLKINIEWGDLPYAPEGFGEYYKDYGKGFENDAFVARLSVLRDGRWRPSGDESENVARLFDGPNGQSVAASRSLDMSVLRWFKHIDPALPEEQFRFDQNSRSGFFRIEVAGPEPAFGHRDYPNLLTTILTENARGVRLKRAPRALPPPPYTPAIKRITFSYTATSFIGPSASHDLGPFAEKTFLIHPFGVETVATNKPWPFLPAVDFDGNLFVGFSASDPAGVLTLLFHLREDSASSLSSVREPVDWSYLVSDKWCPLNASRVLSDTTDGFLSSGIVTLDLPADIDRNNTVMPRDLFWIRISASGNFPSFCSLYSVRAQALTVTRSLSDQAPFVLPEPLPAGSIKGPVDSIPGLRSVLQLMRSSGGQECETAIEQRTRTAERLRHKARAVTVWDYERLVLDAFPEVFKVKCFPAMTSEGGMRPEPGSVLIVVVPRQPEHSRAAVFDPMLDVIKLKRIRDYLCLHSSPQVSIEVRNPAYERLLVRCIVQLKPEAMRQRGVWLGYLNQTLIEYISPWSKTGPTPRFGWSFQNDEVESFVRRLPYVDFVTQFSMLHLTQDEKGSYRLDDTARSNPLQAEIAHTGVSSSMGMQKISPRYPWSIAIPNAVNIIEAADENDISEIPPKVTGIGKLAIGNNFVVIRRDDAKT
ncbi:MAG: baseplate J/gp47 family protein [Terracidiphilus sp.]